MDGSEDRGAGVASVWFFTLRTEFPSGYRVSPDSVTEVYDQYKRASVLCVHMDLTALFETANVSETFRNVASCIKQRNGHQRGSQFFCFYCKLKVLRL